MSLSQAGPTGFSLRQTDPTSQVELYFSGVLRITGGEPPTGMPDAGSTFMMLSLALAGLQGFRWFRARKSE
jgi:hypothetical protein